MSQLVKRVFVLLLMITVAKVWAQNSAPLFYDAAKETTLNGTVVSVLSKPTPGMFPGAHLTLATPTGSSDISLGSFALIGDGALSVSSGQQVVITGVSKLFHGKPVFLARLVQAGGNLYAIRNAHGLPVPPKSHQRANQDAQNGEIR